MSECQIPANSGFWLHLCGFRNGGFPECMESGHEYHVVDWYFWLTIYQITLSTTEIDPDINFSITWAMTL
jgi:hypothetical protein